MKTDPVDSLARGLVVRASSSVEDRQLVAGWLEAEHFLGALRAVGHTLMQFVQQENQVVAVLVWAASAYHLKDRDQWIGWDAITCAKRRNLITNNVRFLVREEHRRPNLASQSLAAALKILPQQWQEHFGYRPLLAETFTDPELHAGTCYKATAGTGATFTFPMNDPSDCGSNRCIPGPESGSAHRICRWNANRGNGRRVPVRGAP